MAQKFDTKKKKPSARRDIYRKGKKTRTQKKKAPEPFRPLAPGFETRNQFQRGVNQRARGMYQPLLDEVSSNERTEQRKHTGRTADLTSWQSQMQGNLDKAFEETHSALNDLIALGTGNNAAIQNSMRAALDRTGQENQQMEGLIGGDIDETPALQTAAASLAGPSAMDQALNRSSGALLTGAGENRALAGLAGARGIEQEGLRYGGVTDELAQNRQDIVGRIPAFREQARGAILDEERSAQNQRFQQGLARDEFGFRKKESNRNFRLARGNQRFQQWLAEAGFNLQSFQAHDQSNISWAQIAIDRDQLDIQRQQLQNDINKGTSGFSEADAKRWDNAVSTMTGFLSPSDEDRYGKTDKEGSPNPRAGKVNPKLYNRNHQPEDLYRVLTGQVRMSPGGALRLMMSANKDNIRGWARKTLRGRKFTKAHRGTLTPRNRGGTPG